MNPTIALQKTFVMFMNHPTSHLVFATGMAIYVAVRVLFQRRTAHHAKAVNKASLRDRMLIVGVGACQIGLPATLMLTPWLDAFNYALPALSTWIGSLVLACALWLFWRSHIDLGNGWSVTLQLNQNHRLVTHGVYRRIRHPMYASFFAMGIGQVMLLNNAITGWAALIAMSLLYAYRTPREEQMMLESFGDEYRVYMRRTGGVLPRLSPRPVES